MDQNILTNFTNPSGSCYVQPEPKKIEYLEPPFTLDNQNRILFRKELFAWYENRRGEKVGFGDDAGFIMNIVTLAYDLGCGNKHIK
jgi:hypothetical protein